MYTPRRFDLLNHQDHAQNGRSTERIFLQQRCRHIVQDDDAAVYQREEYRARHVLERDQDGH